MKTVLETCSEPKAYISLKWGRQGVVELLMNMIELEYCYIIIFVKIS